VMCEKPMAKTAADARRMLEAAERTGRKLAIGYQNRYRPDTRYLKDACANDELGEIYFAKAHAIRRRAVPTWGVFLDEEKQGGGPLIDIGTHALDLALWLMDNYKPKVVLGRAYHKLSQTENAANAWGPWDPKQFTVEDSAFAMITMENGASIVLESSWALNTLEVDEAKVTMKTCGALLETRGAFVMFRIINTFLIDRPGFSQTFLMVCCDNKGIDYNSKGDKMAGATVLEKTVYYRSDGRFPCIHGYGYLYVSRSAKVGGRRAFRAVQPQALRARVECHRSGGARRQNGFGPVH
ncbi:oxidoreductase, partial [Paenibacillus darwinianus]|uniref:Gfo/Idh/MocA family protein n=1 Tax=Paenibacillus darwinianus TaxID=1380763 RepID=UPI0004479706